MNFHSVVCSFKVVYESVSEPYSYLQIKPAAVEVFDEKNEDAKKNDGKELNQTYWAITSYEKRSSGEVDLRDGSLVTVLQRQLSG